ncbi:hypothetical protein RND81_12G060100 [Saponaria officinalis]|uniref:RNase H type-1 domain-containing protein n=1 Tax=Saponaria officinalis TaxID=3572 RepID=A0AAW1H3Q8_SAPOF
MPVMMARTNWNLPPEGSYKLNTDASLLSLGEMGLGGVLRDERGVVKATMVGRIKAKWIDMHVTGAAASCFGLRIARDLGVQR